MDELPELPEKVQQWVGQTLIEEDSEIVVERGAIENSCSSVENGNPLYWDEKTANELTAGPTAPPTMLSVWLRPHLWAPNRGEPRMSLELHFMLKRELDLPEAIITKNGVVFGEPVRVGDRLRSAQKLRSISEPKRNKLGLGRYWIIDVEYYNQKNDYLGSEWYNCFGYRRD